MSWSRSLLRVRRAGLRRHSAPNSVHGNERGSVEAGLAIIPTTIFFLLVVQIVLAGSWQVIERSRLHDLILRSEVSGREVVAGSTGDGNLSFQKKDYLGVGSVTRYELKSEVPTFRALSNGSNEAIMVRNFAIRIQ